MKKFVISILGCCVLMIHSTAFAQFNTISKVKILYKVDSPALVNEKSIETAEIGESDDTPIISDKVNTKEERKDYSKSVAYPLGSIIITSAFGYRKDPFTGKRKMHNGLDLHARSDEVYSMLYGKVIKVGEDKTSGKYVVLQHGDFRISYCHLSTILISKGSEVKAGDVVGITGSTGRSTGEHLHITAKFRNEYIDPMLLIEYIQGYNGILAK